MECLFLEHSLMLWVFLEIGFWWVLKKRVFL
jgi:hypothetical protein